MTAALGKLTLIAAMLVAVVWHPEAGAAEADRVLVIGFASQPLIQDVAAAVQAHARHNRRTPGPDLQADVRLVRSGQSETEFVRQLQPPLQRYRAVFAATMALARAVQVADPRMPLVFHGEANPVDLCLVDSMQKPGRSATGYVNYLVGDDAKLVEALVEAFPQVHTIFFGAAGSNYYVADCGPHAEVREGEPPPCVPGVHAIDGYLERIVEPAGIVEQGRRLGVDIRFLLLCGPGDFAQIGELARTRPDAGFVFSYQGLFSVHAASLVDSVARARRPAIFGKAALARRGGVLAMEPIRDASDARVAIDMLLQVLDGRAPASMPVQMPRGFRLSINAAAAAAQGLQPSLRSLRRADEVLLRPEAP